MRDQDKTKEQLIGELMLMGQRIAQLEDAESEPERAEEALRESEKKYHILCDSIIEGFCIIEMLFDDQGNPVDYRFLEVNPEFEKHTGLYQAEGKLMRELAPDHEAHWFEIYGKIALTGEPARFVNEAKALNRWYEVNAFRFGGPESRKVAICFSDITERKRAEESLLAARVEAEKQKNRLEAVFEALPVGAAVIDAKGGNIQSNAMFEQVWGSPRPAVHEVSDYAAYKAWWADTGQLLRPEDWASAIAVSRGEAAIGQLVQIERFDGEHAFVLNSAVPITNVDGQVESCAVAIMDVTERRRAEEALQRKESELREAQRIAHIGSWYWDAKTDTTAGSDELLQIYGYDPATQFMPAFQDQKGCCYPDEEWERVNAAVQKTLQTGVGYELDVQALRNGEFRWVTTRSEVVRDANGQIVGLRGTVQDITEHKRAEQALQEAHERAAWLARFPEENPNPVVRVSAEGNVLYRNRAAGEFPGWTCEVGMLLPDSLLPMIKKAMTEGQEAQQEVGLGGRLYSVSVTPFTEEHYANVYGVDITERKRMEQEIRRAHDELEVRVQERTRELVMAERFILRANHALQTINACNNVLIRDTEELDLLNHVCRIIVEIGGYRMAWVGSAEQDKKKTVRPLACAGYNEGYLETADISWADTERGRGPTGLAIREGKIHTGKDMQTQLNLGPWRAEALRRGYASSIALPLIVNTRTYGALTIYGSEPDAFNEEETKLLASLADNLSYGIASIQAHIERERAEEKIARANAMLETVFDGISDPLLMLEKDCRIRMLNEAACKYFHIANREDVIAKTCYEVTLGRCGPCGGCDISSAIPEGKKTTFERNGALDPERIEQITVYPVDEAISGVSGAIVRISDITESRNMEKHLTRADRLSSLGVLAGGIAHEIRNPLAGINLFIDVLSDEEKFSRTSQEQDILEEIKTNIKKINGIIKRILDFSRQSETATLKNVNASALIQDSLKPWQSRMTKDGIQLRLLVEEKLSEVLGDPIEIQQVLTNLVQNAVEAIGKNGTLSIGAQNGTLSFDAKRPAVIIKVQDSGPGIPPDQQKNIFNPFFSTKHTGTGLGLAISHRIVSRHGGLISFESVQDVGTTFTVELAAAPWS